MDVAWTSRIPILSVSLYIMKVSADLCSFDWFCSIFQEQKRLQEQFAAEQEALFGSRPKKPLGQTNAMVGTPTSRRVSTPSGKHGVSNLKERRETGRVNHVIPLNFVALPKDDPMSRGN